MILSFIICTKNKIEMAVPHRVYLFQDGFLIYFIPGVATLLDTVGFTA